MCSPAFFTDEAGGSQLVLRGGRLTASGRSSQHGDDTSKTSLAECSHGATLGDGVAISEARRNFVINSLHDLRTYLHTDDADNSAAALNPIYHWSK